MAVQFNGNIANYLTRTTSLPDFNSPYTVMAWVYLSSDTNAFTTLWYFGVNNGGEHADALHTDTDGTTLLFWCAGPPISWSRGNRSIYIPSSTAKVSPTKLIQSELTNFAPRWKYSSY